MRMRQLIVSINRLGIHNTRMIKEALYSHVCNLEYRMKEALPHAYLKEKYAFEKALQGIICNGSYTFRVAQWGHNETPPSIDEIKKEVRLVAGAWRKLGVQLKEISEVPEGCVVYATFET